MTHVMFVRTKNYLHHILHHLQRRKIVYRKLRCCVGRRNWQGPINDNIRQGGDLNRILYVPKLRKNLVSITILTKNGFKCVFVYDKVVVSKNEMYVGKG